MDADDGIAGGGGELHDRAAGDRPRRSRYTTRFFTVLLFASLYLISQRWREKDRTAAASAAPTPSEIAGVVSFFASLLYLLPLLRDL